MPLGGLKWRDELEGELEKREFKRIKSEVQLLGIDDAPFDSGDKRVKIVAVLTRGGKMLEGVFHSDIKRDGLDATDKIIGLVKDIRRENARAILLDGITYGGFNTVDIQRVFRGTGIPVIACMKKRPDHARINDALKNLGDRELRAGMIKAAGKVREVILDSERTIYMQVAGIKEKDAEGILRVATVNGLVPEPLRAAHMIAKGAYKEVERRDLVVDDPPHIRAYLYVKHKHKQAKRLKKRYLPGAAGEIASFLFAFLIAWLVIQGLGWVLNTTTPLVVVESESMIHSGNWQDWYLNNGVNPDVFGFGSGMGIGDIILVKGDNTDDIGIGDVIVYSRYGPYGNGITFGGEPIIHRVIGIVDISGRDVKTIGEVQYKNGQILTPCNGKAGYSIPEIKSLYSKKPILERYPNIDLDDFRLFITKGDNNGEEDQCAHNNGIPSVSYPIHEDLVVGRAKFDIPYLGYVKLGIVCAGRYMTGSACSCRCWWAADSPKCCR